MVARDFDFFHAEFTVMEEVNRSVKVNFLWHYLRASYALTCGCSVAITCGCSMAELAKATTRPLQRIAVATVLHCYGSAPEALLVRGCLRVQAGAVEFF